MGSEQQSQNKTIGRLGRWHNHLPGWILEHPGYKGLNPAARQLLQAIADDGTVQKDGGLDNGFGSDREYADRIGASVSTIRRQLRNLVRHPPGFLIVKIRGGKTRLHQRTGTLTLATAYRIAGTAPTVEDLAVRCPLRCSNWTPVGSILEGTGVQNAPPLSEIQSQIRIPDIRTKRRMILRCAGRRLDSGDLNDHFFLRRFRERLIHAGTITNSENDAIWFCTAVVHALRLGKQPGALLVALLSDRQQKWLYCSIDDENTGARLWSDILNL